MPASILVVDDESTITDALQLLLSDHGYDVTSRLQPKKPKHHSPGAGLISCFSICVCPTPMASICSNTSNDTAPDVEVVLMTAHGLARNHHRGNQARRFLLSRETVRVRTGSASRRKSLQFKQIKAESQVKRVIERRIATISESSATT